MKVSCKDHPYVDTVRVVITQQIDRPCIISILCSTCGSFLWEAVSHVIASTAVTEKGSIR